VLDGWTPDYTVYWLGARMAREGLDPHALLEYWYPLPVVLVTTMPWSFLPHHYALAFALIPLGLLHLRYGRWTPLWFMFVPLVINTLYAQYEGWLILPIFWVLEDHSVRGALSIFALMFKACLWHLPCSLPALAVGARSAPQSTRLAGRHKHDNHGCCLCSPAGLARSVVQWRTQTPEQPRHHTQEYDRLGLL
jgi:hypothetical protein